MNGFSYFVLYMTVTIQAECKRHHDTAETDQFRRQIQIQPQLSYHTQQMPRLIRLTPGLQPMGNYEVFKIKKDLHQVETKPPVVVNVDTVKTQELQETQSIKRTPEVPKNVPKNLLATPQKLKEEKKSQGLRNAKKLTKKPKKLNEKQKKAIRARYYQRERSDVLDIERQKVEELKQKVKRLQMNLNSNKTKNKAKNLLPTNGPQQASSKPLMRSNLGYGESMKIPRRKRKKQKSSNSATTVQPVKSRFFVQTNTEKTTSTVGTSASPKVKKSSDSSSSSDEEPVMRGANKLDDDDDDDELNFDVEGELLSQIFK